MNIYEIGEEKCIDGVWGREVDGRFYTFVKPSDQSVLYRKLDIDTINSAYFAQRSCTVVDNTEYITSDMYMTLVGYTPKHIKDLENLKRGDIVWVLDKSDRGDEWTSTIFITKNNHNYITSNMFMPCGHVLSSWKKYHKTVFLKPPFNF